MEQPLVSIIVPVYKVPEQYLRKCIESIMAQTLEQIEILLVDDGSPDNCGEICDEYAQIDERIKVIHKKNGGVGAARNAGISEASGVFVSFLDGDDWVDIDTYRYAVQKALETNSELVSWNHYYEYENKQTKRDSMPTEEILYSIDDIKSRLIYDYITPEYDIRFYNTHLGAIRGVWGKLYRLNVIRHYNIEFDTDLKIGEDACFNIKYAYKIKRALFINQYFNHYRITETSANHRVRSDIEQIRIGLLNKYYHLIENHDDSFWLCYNREILSGIVNCMIKFYCTSATSLKFKEKMNKIRNLLRSTEIVCAREGECNLDNNFFKPSERILLHMIYRENVFGIYVVGKGLVGVRNIKNDICRCKRKFGQSNV